MRLIYTSCVVSSTHTLFSSYYPEAEEVYPGVNTVVMDEDAMDLTEPILKPAKKKTFTVLSTEVPELTVSTEVRFVPLASPPRHLVSVLSCF